MRRCLTKIGCINGGLALDIPCGFGRHALWLAENGVKVVGVDLDAARAQTTHMSGRRHGRRLPVAALVADIERPLPFRDQTFDLALVIHYFSDEALHNVGPTLKKDGYLIVETFGAQGRNWESLPKKGQLERILRGAFRILDVKERPAGPAGRHVVAMALAQRL